mgnify:CR=1 FL=1
MALARIVQFFQNRTDTSCTIPSLTQPFPARHRRREIPPPSPLPGKGYYAVPMERRGSPLHAFTFTEWFTRIKPLPVGKGQTAEMRTLCHSGANLVPSKSPEGDFDFLVDSVTRSHLCVALPQECVLPPAQDKTAHGARRGQSARNTCADHLHTGTSCGRQGKRGERPFSFYPDQ